MAVDATERPATSGAAEALWRLAPALGSALAFAAFVALLPSIAGGGAIAVAWPWIPAMGVELAFLIDGLGLTFALLITGIGALVLLYTSAYFRTDPRLGRLLTLLVLFEISMLGLVLADDLVLLFVFWELTTVTSFLLVGFDHEKAEARAKALQALLVTGAGGLALLAGVLLLGAVAGTFRVSALADAATTIRDGGLYVPIVILVLLGCFTKSAQFPFHFWLPNAMAAPTPVSAYLHSATMVKAGVYLMARLSPALGDTALWFWTLTIVGGITAVLASVWALRQTDLKLALAYTTVMALGTLTMFLGAGNAYAAAGVATFLVVHAFYKAALFLTIGIVDKKAGTRQVDELGGLGGPMRLTWIIASLAGLAMAGFPPFLGFVGKELKYEAALGAVTSPVLIVILAVAAKAMMVAVAGKIAIKPFVGPKTKAAERAEDPPLAMWLGPAILGIGGIVFGLDPARIGDVLVLPITASITGAEVEVKLMLWHGLNLALLLSVLTFALGITIYLFMEPIRRRLTRLEAGGVWGAESGYDEALAGMKRFAAWQTRLIQPGRVSTYLFATALTLAALLWAAILAGGGVPWPRLQALPLIEWTVLGLIAVASVAVTLTASRLVAILSLGVVGTAVAALFVLYGAIDVAMTQLLVETLFVVIVAVALLKLPRLRSTASGRDAGVRWGDAAVSVALGLAVTGALLAVLGTDLDRYVTAYFEAESAPTAYGRNVVNVILVDFRALDTLGEIGVVVLAALGALALVRLKSDRTARPSQTSENAEP